MRRYGGALVRMCCLYLNDASLAQDAAQGIPSSGMENLGQFRGECDERTWLMRIAISTCRDYHRGMAAPWTAAPLGGAACLRRARRTSTRTAGYVRSVTALPRRERGDAPALLSEMTIAGGSTGAAHIRSAVKQRLQRARPGYGTG